MANDAVIFGLLGAGGILLTSAVTGSSIGQVLTGHPGSIGTSSPYSGLLGGVQAAGGTVAAAGKAAGGALGKVKVGKTTATETGFATSFLNAIGAPLNKTNIAALEDWWAQEEGTAVLVAGHGGLNNPFEVTTSGNANVPSLGSVNASGVKSYATPQQGVEAAIGYFQTYGPGVLTAFRNGESISNIEQAVRDLGPNAFGSDTNAPWSVG